MLENRDIWLGVNAKWTLSYWKAGFLWASCYCWRALVTKQLLFDFLRSVHIPSYFYTIAHQQQHTGDSLTCPSRKRTRGINDCCIPFIGGPATVQVMVPDYIHLCLSSYNKPNCGLMSRQVESHHQGDHSHLVLLVCIYDGPSPGFHWSFAKFGSPSAFTFDFVPTTSTQQ